MPTQRMASAMGRVSSQTHDTNEARISTGSNRELATPKHRGPTALQAYKIKSPQHRELATLWDHNTTEPQAHDATSLKAHSAATPRTGGFTTL
jgi:hypothetical protein